MNDTYFPHRNAFGPSDGNFSRITTVQVVAIIDD